MMVTLVYFAFTLSLSRQKMSTSATKGNRVQHQFDKWRHLPADENRRGLKRRRGNEMKGEQERRRIDDVRGGKRPPFPTVRPPVCAAAASCLPSIYRSNKNAA